VGVLSIPAYEKVTCGEKDARGDDTRNTSVVVVVVVVVESGGLFNDNIFSELFLCRLEKDSRSSTFSYSLEVL